MEKRRKIIVVMSCYECRKFGALGFLLLLLLCCQCGGLNTDGVLLLSFKYSVLSDPLLVLDNWDHSHLSPCLWKGVTCSHGTRRVIVLALPNCSLRGTIPVSLGRIRFLRKLDLSNNKLNGSIPESLFNAPALRFLDLSDNLIFGSIPVPSGGSGNLEFLNLSDNDLVGEIPGDLTSLGNLVALGLRNNYISGNFPRKIHSIQILDVSSNLINGSLVGELGGESLRYLNISHNQISGFIPTRFASRMKNAIIDFSFNNFSGEIPNSMRGKPEAVSGNSGLCGEPFRKPCPIPSTVYAAAEPTTSSAIAAFPRSTTEKGSRTDVLKKPVTIIGIVVGDIVGITILALTFWYLFHRRKKQIRNRASSPSDQNSKKQSQTKNEATIHEWSTPSPESSAPKSLSPWSCLPNRGDNENDEASSASETGITDVNTIDCKRQSLESQRSQGGGGGCLVTVDDTEMELECLLKGSASILGATGSSIMYRVVLDNGTALAVRRIGETGIERMKDFEFQIRGIAKFSHANIIKVRGFYWSEDDKLIVYEYASNGCLANARYRKMAGSPCHLPWEIRLRVARGVARGLAYLHEKKQVHGNLKPSNILLDSDFEPKISDFGLERLICSKPIGGSIRNFGSKRSTASQDQASPSPSPSPSAIGCASPYQAPESLRSLKATPKWDSYSFGVILMELLSGRVVDAEEAAAEMAATVTAEEERRKMMMVKMTDTAIRGEVEGKEETLVGWLKLGTECMAAVPQKRPTMKDALQVLDKICLSSSSCSHHP